MFKCVSTVSTSQKAQRGGHITCTRIMPYGLVGTLLPRYLAWPRPSPVSPTHPAHTLGAHLQPQHIMPGSCLLLDACAGMSQSMSYFMRDRCR